MTQAASLWTNAGQYPSAAHTQVQVGCCPPEAPAELARLPASAQRVYDTIARKGPQTHRDLLEATSLPARTVRYAVSRLRGVGLVATRGNLRDLRQSFFVLASALPARDPMITVRHRLL